MRTSVKIQNFVNYTVVTSTYYMAVIPSSFTIIEALPAELKLVSSGKHFDIVFEKVAANRKKLVLWSGVVMSEFRKIWQIASMLEGDK